jgi:hypothetical protein
MAVVSLYNHQELQVEAVHLAIALAYYGLLRVPSRIEASEVEICQSFYFIISGCFMGLCRCADLGGTSYAKPLSSDLAIRQAIHAFGPQRGDAVCV